MPQLRSHIVDLGEEITRLLSARPSIPPLASRPPPEFLPPTPEDHPMLNRLDAGAIDRIPVPNSDDAPLMPNQAHARRSKRKPIPKRFHDSEYEPRTTRKPRGRGKTSNIRNPKGETPTTGSEVHGQPTKTSSASKSSDNINDAVDDTPKSTKTTDEWESLREICGRRGAKEFMEYQVKWDGYESDDPRAKSWVPRTMLVEDVPEDVEVFDKEFRPAKRARRV